jgi:hypothetical protein
MRRPAPPAARPDARPDARPGAPLAATRPAGRVPKDRVAIIIGAMKCGTTSLYDYLVAHPAIAPCLAKEPEWFSRAQSHRLDVPEYEDLWPDWDPARHEWALEASTGYTKYPAEAGVPERMRDHGLAPKLLYLVRDPFARIESHVQHIRHLPFERDPLDEHVLATTDYALQLDHWRAVFPAGDILVLDFDDLAARPAETVARAAAHLGLPPPPPRATYQAANRTAPTRKLHARFRTGPLGFLAPVIPGRLFHAADRLAARLRPEARRRLSQAERDLIRERLGPAMRRLEAEWGVPTAKWGL